MKVICNKADEYSCFLDTMCRHAENHKMKEGCHGSCLEEDKCSTVNEKVKCIPVEEPQKFLRKKQGRKG